MKLKFKGDSVLLVLVCVLALFGVVMVYSALSFTANKDYGNAYYYAFKQLIGFLLGLILMFFTACFDYKNYLGKCRWLCLGSIILLAAIFIPGLGVEVYGAKRWLNLGFFTVQPSELAKFCYVFWLAEYFSKDMSRAKSFKGILMPLLVGVIICVTIMLEPNMSITMCVALIMLIVLFSAGVKIKHFMLIFVKSICEFRPRKIVLQNHSNLLCCAIQTDGFSYSFFQLINYKFRKIPFHKSLSSWYHKRCNTASDIDHVSHRAA